LSVDTAGAEGVCPYTAGIVFSFAAAINVFPKSATSEA